NFFDLNNGAINAKNTTVDFLLGGTATTSAKFAILGVNDARGSQTASLSGNLVLDAAGSLQTTNKQTLTIGGDTTGSILFKPNNNSVNLFLSGANAAIGNQNPQAALDVSSSSHLSAPVNKIIWGSIGNTMGMLGYDGGSADEIRIGATSNVGLELITNDNVVGYFTSTGKFGLGTVTPSEQLDVNGNATVSGNLSLYGGARSIQTTENQSLTIGGGATGDLTLGRASQSLFLPNFTSNGGLLYTSSTGLLTQLGSGTTSQCLNANTGAAPSWGACDGAASVNVFEFANGTARTTNQTVDLLVGGVSTESAKFAILGVNNARGSQTASLSGNLVLDAAGSLTTTNNQTLTIGGGNTGNIVLSPLTTTTLGGSTVFSSLSTGIAHIGSTGLLSSSAINLASSDVTGILPYANGGSPFNVDSSLGTIFTGNNTLDVLLGGTSTASAKFGFLNIAGGTPTASISAGTSGALYLSANGSLQTTAFQTLTIGGSTTGNVAINPKA
ncbi:MAG: hypothetical protein Q7T74_03210, partial [Candidatus Saccharibacteria bacterium]|nr:hypothetical protein [Candidatus Saccharibacteria bacterium]